MRVRLVRAQIFWMERKEEKKNMLFFPSPNPFSLSQEWESTLFLSPIVAREKRKISYTHTAVKLMCWLMITVYNNSPLVFKRILRCLYTHIYIYSEQHFLCLQLNNFPRHKLFLGFCISLSFFGGRRASFFNKQKRHRCLRLLM